MSGLPQGFYAVPDPDDERRVTYWSVNRDGGVRDFPFGHRWRPLPPRGMSKTEKAEVFYAPDGPYRQWRAEVARRIGADLTGAAARFAAKYPHPHEVPGVRYDYPLPVRTTPKAPSPTARRRAGLRDTQSLLVAALREQGRSFRLISEALNIPLGTAYRRAERGRELQRAGGLSASARRDFTAQLESAFAALSGRDRPSVADRETVAMVVRVLTRGVSSGAVTEVKRTADPAHGTRRNGRSLE